MERVRMPSVKAISSILLVCVACIGTLANADPARLLEGPPKKLPGLPTTQVQPVKKQIEFVPLSSYKKAVTQFDGVLADEVVNYLSLKADQGVLLPVMSTGKINRGLSYTVMMWFKISQGALRRQELMYLFSFEGSVSCYFTKSAMLMCDSSNRQKIQVDVSHIQEEKWIHFTLSGTSSGKAYLQLSSPTNVLALKQVKSFYLKQMRRTKWRACLGDCKTNFGLVGGVREFMVLSASMNPGMAFNAKNMQMTYRPMFKAYFRFNEAGDRFSRDKFVDRAWMKAPKNAKASQYIETDIIPNDICPYTNENTEFVRLGSGQSIKDYVMESTVQPSNYFYTISMTFMADGRQCKTKSRQGAADSCHMFKINELFMIYFYSNNMARVHFFAKKRYSEHQSSLFFLPHSQWITLQMTVSHYDGYQILLLDHNARVFYNKKRKRNMRTIMPTKQVSLVKKFSGFLARVKFCNQAFTLPVDDSTMTDCQLDLNLVGTKSGGWDGTGIVNFGVGGKPLAFMRKPEVRWVPYQLQRVGQSVGTLGTMKQATAFDGIACHDGFKTLKLNDSNSQLSFKPLALNDWSSQITIEFWFKPLSEQGYYKDAQIFSFYDKTNKKNFFQVKIQGGELVLAPFGTEQLSLPAIAFKEFKYQNKDRLGWWHVSCSYSFGKIMRATLYNSESVNAEETESLIEQPIYFPKSSLEGQFGKSTNAGKGVSGGLLIKEFRMWTEQRTKEQIDIFRQSQVDPTIKENSKLIHYLRLASASHKHTNFARFNKNYDFSKVKDTVSDVEGDSYVSDFETKSVYKFDPKLKKVIESDVKTHHVVCPLYTYFMKNKCYREPVNKITFAAYPNWNADKETLVWDFDLLSSSLIDAKLIKTLNEKWSASSFVLQSSFDKRGDAFKSFSRSVSLPFLRNEGSYSLMVSLENQQKTFLYEQQINFIPSFCRWFVVKGSDARSGRTTLEVFNGVQDISFILKLQKNSSLECKGFRFYDKFQTIEFDFLTSNTDQFIEKKPEMQWSMYNPSLANEQALVKDGKKGEGSRDTVDPMADDLQIRVTLPRSEQTKLPANEDVGIFMTVRWTSDKFSELLQKQQTKQKQKKPVFQNLLYTVKFAPKQQELVASLVASTNQPIQKTDVILDASESRITNVTTNESRKDLTFQWKCPRQFKNFCMTKDDKIKLGWNDVKRMGVNFEYSYKFDLIITWAKPNGMVDARRLSTTITWYNAARPDFNIVFRPMPVLVTGPQNTIFSIDPLNFQTNDLRMYEVTWTIQPDLQNPQMRSVLQFGQLMEVQRKAFKENTDYTVSAKIEYRSLKVLTAQKVITFATKAPPKGGKVKIQPEKGVIGQPFTIVCEGWNSENQPIVYNVFTTSDAQGLIKKAQINQQGAIAITELFQFKITRTTPVQVEVTDTSGEKKVFLLFTKISLERKWVDPIGKNQPITPTTPVVPAKPVTPESKPIVAVQPTQPVVVAPTNTDPVKPSVKVVVPTNEDPFSKIFPATKKPVVKPTDPEKPVAGNTQKPKVKPVVVVRLTEEEQIQKDIKNLFDKADKNKNFQLSLNEFKDFLVISLTAGAANEKIIADLKAKPVSLFTRSFEATDKDNDGSLSWTEVWTARARPLGKPDGKPVDTGNKKAPVKKRPTNKITSFLTAAELIKVKMGLRYLFDEVDLNPLDSELNTNEFTNFMQNVMHRDKVSSAVIQSMTTKSNMANIFRMADINEDKVISFEETWNFWLGTKFGQKLIETLIDDEIVQDIILDEVIEKTEGTKLNSISILDTKPGNLLLKLQQEPDYKAKQKVALMSRIVETQGTLPSSQEEVIEFMEGKKQMISELKAQTQRYYTVEGQYGSNLSPDQFAQKAVAIISDILGQHALIDRQIITESVVVLEGLQKLRSNTKLQIVLADAKQYRQNYIESLERINRFVRTSEVKNTRRDQQMKAWLLAQVQAQADEICKDSALGSFFNYDGDGEIGIATGQFENMKKNRSFRLSALDSSYLVHADTLLREVSAQNEFSGKLCAQYSAINGFASKQANLSGYSRGVVQFDLLETETDERHNLEELVNHIEVQFALSPSTYLSNQTICMARTENQPWKSDNCLTKVMPSTFTIRCQCTSFSTDQIALVNDMSRAKGAAVPEFENHNAVVVKEEQLNHELAVYYVSAVWTCTLFLLSICATISVIRSDKKDWARLRQISDQNQVTELQATQLLSNVATVLEEPVEHVRARRSELMSYTSLWNYSRFGATVYKVHPLIAPFSSFRLQASRLIRLSAYMLQMNTFLVITLCVFSEKAYRGNDTARNAEVFEFRDVHTLLQTAFIGSVCLLPIISEPIIWLLESKSSEIIEQDGQLAVASAGTLKLLLRGLLVTVSLGMGLTSCVLAGVWSKGTPTSNQYCVVAAVTLGLMVSTFVTNMLRVLLSTCLTSLGSNCVVRLLSSALAREVAKDMEAVKIAEKMMSKKMGDPINDSEFASISPSKVAAVKPVNLADALNDQQQEELADNNGLSARSAAGEMEAPASAQNFMHTQICGEVEAASRPSGVLKKNSKTVQEKVSYNACVQLSLADEAD